MRIFASWSGTPSREVAELLREWLPLVVQDVEVYVSSQDIGKGERWLASIGSNLSEIDFGIIVVTKDNISAPWILFEAGALSKSVKGVVIPLLCGIDTLEAATSPLIQFQYARTTESEMKDMVVQINSFASKPLDQNRLDRAFTKWWPDFKDSYEKIEFPEKAKPKNESDNTRLLHIEDAVSSMIHEMRSMRKMLEIRSTMTNASEVRRRKGNLTNIDLIRADELQRQIFEREKANIRRQKMETRESED